jgi:4'-phosphopantetheinyl transferase
MRPLSLADPIPAPAALPVVSLWWSNLAYTPESLARVELWLSAAELARAGRFGTQALRDRYVCGRATLRSVLAQRLGVEPKVVPIRRGPRGRPELDTAAVELDFNVSHTDGGAVIGIVEAGNNRIGVDVERTDRSVGAERLARKFLSPDEQSALGHAEPAQRRALFLRYWTCKEAMSKATGDGLSAPFAKLSVDIASSLRLVAGPHPYQPDAWRLSALDVPEGFLATVALWSTAV